MVRVVVGLGAAGAGVAWALSGALVPGVLTGVSGLGLAVTGLVGWCPLCAAVGRTLPEPKRQIPVTRL